MTPDFLMQVKRDPNDACWEPDVESPTPTKKETAKTPPPPPNWPPRSVEKPKPVIVPAQQPVLGRKKWNPNLPNTSPD